MYRLFILLILSASILHGQVTNNKIYIEHNSSFVNLEQTEFISYKIPVINLLFTKNIDNYLAPFTLTLEFYQDDIFVHREITSSTVAVSNYEETHSVNNFYQDLIEFKLQPGSYKLKPLLSLGSSNVEYKIPELHLIIDSLSQKSINYPLIISSNNSKNDSITEFELANNGGRIPFSSEEYDLLVGVKDSNCNYLNISIEQDDKVIISDSLVPFLLGNMIIKKQNNYISVLHSKIGENKYFRISNFSNELSEGIAKLKISYASNEKEFPLSIKWMNKPKVLQNPEYSIKLVGYIEEEEIVGELLSYSNKMYYEKLAEYWNENYPANGIKFNYAMSEYYARADYAIKNLSSLNSLDGAERDRGKIYITYGKPTSIDRNYTEKNEIVEYWSYEKVGRTFVFKDFNGTGKFDLVE